MEQTFAQSAPVKKIWIFEEDTFLGDFNTRLAIAEAFSDAEVKVLKRITEPDVESFLQSRFGKSTLTIQDWPDLVVHSIAKESEIDILLELKKRSKNKIFLTVVDDPGKRRAEIDLIVNPRHMPSILTGTGNVIRPLGLPSRVTPEILHAQHQLFGSRLSHYPGPVVVLLLGGQTKSALFTVADAKALGENVRKAVKSVGGSLFVTNSRRTPQRSFEALLDELTGFPIYLHDVNATDSDINPYIALLSYADHIIVTGDSSSMMSDALSTGRPVYTFAPGSTVEDRHRRFILDMVDAGKVEFLKGTLDGYDQAPLTVQQDIRKVIEARRTRKANSLKSCIELLINHVASIITESKSELRR